MASRGHSKPTLTHGGELERRSDVRLSELWKVTDDLVVRHATRQVLEHVVDRDAGADKARLAAPKRWQPGSGSPESA